MLPTILQHDLFSHCSARYVLPYVRQCFCHCSSTCFFSPLFGSMFIFPNVGQYVWFFQLFFSMFVLSHFSVGMFFYQMFDSMFFFPPLFGKMFIFPLFSNICNFATVRNYVCFLSIVRQYACFHMLLTMICINHNNKICLSCSFCLGKFLEFCLGKLLDASNGFSLV